MLKTRKEIFRWLLKKREGNYEELIKEIGKEMVKDLEILGYIHKGYSTDKNLKKGEIVWGLTERGERMAYLLVNGKISKKKSLGDILKKFLF